MTADDIANRIEAFLRSQYSIGADDQCFTRDVDLFDFGYVDSIGLAELLTFIRINFKVQINYDDLLADQFSSIYGIAKIVCHRGEW